MEHKYYIPEISEFHIGFEYECKEADGWKGWICYRVDEQDALDIQFERVRVKYLDEEDFRSLGFIESPRGDRWDKDDIQIYHTTSDPAHIEIYSNRGEDFVGTIKNKSELKRLLKQLGYEIHTKPTLEERAQS